jgi:hypothetical protein
LGIPVDQLAYQAVLHSYQELLNRRVTGVFTRYLSENPALIPPIAQIRTPEGDILESLPPHLLPDKDLLLSCSTTIDGKQGWGVFQYSLSTGDWDQVFQREYESGDSGFIFPLPEGKGYAIQEYLRGEPLTARMLLWQDGETIVVGEQTVNFDNALFAPYYLRDMDPSGRYLLIGVTNETGEGWFLLDREMCDEESGCVLQAIINRPIWSPDGRQTLMQEQQPSGDSTVYRTLYLADEFGQNPIEIGTGTSPFWVNENTYGYSRLKEDSQMELVFSDWEKSWVAIKESELI